MTTVVNPSSGEGGGTALAVIFGLIVVALVGYMIYAFNGGTLGPQRVIEHNTVIETPSMPKVPTPAPEPAPSTP